MKVIFEGKSKLHNLNGSCRDEAREGAALGFAV